jgi:hypothetical protein
MNAPFTPVDSHSAAADLSAFLQLLTDPVATKARLDELVAQEKATKASIAELNDMASETRRLHGTAQAVNILCDRRLAAIEEREAELDERAKSLDNSEAMKSAAAVQRRESANDAKENSLVRREAAVAKREAAVDAREAKIKAALS